MNKFKIALCVIALSTTTNVLAESTKPKIQEMQEIVYNISIGKDAIDNETKYSFGLTGNFLRVQDKVNIGAFVEHTMTPYIDYNTTGIQAQLDIGEGLAIYAGVGVIAISEMPLEKFHKFGIVSRTENSDIYFEYNNGFTVGIGVVL